MYRQAAKYDGILVTCRVDCDRVECGLHCLKGKKMKLIVSIKRVIDPYVTIRIKPDHTGVETQGVKMAMNPFDEIAVEEAVRLKEAGIASEVVAVSIGPEKTQETLRVALALGADRAIWVKTDDVIEPLAVAQGLKSIVTDEAPRLVILGKQAIDDECGQVGPMLAALLHWPQASFASRLLVKDDAIEVSCEIDGGLQILSLALPAVVTTDLRLNEPRYATLPNIMKAKKKPLEQIPVDALGIVTTPRIETIKIEPPPLRQAGIKLASVEQLVQTLREKTNLIQG